MSDWKEQGYLDETKQVVYRNGIFAERPEWMSEEYWLNYEAPRIGTRVGKGGKFIYGADYPQPTFGSDDVGEGVCSGGGCAI